MVKQIAYLLQSQTKRGANAKKASLKVPHAQVDNTKTKQIAALFRKGNKDGHKKTSTTP